MCCTRGVAGVYVRLVCFRPACTPSCMSSACRVRGTVAHAEGRCCCSSARQVCSTTTKGRKGAMMLTDAARPLELRTWQPTRYPGAEVPVDSRWLPARKNTGGHRRCRQRDGNTLANNRRWHLIFWFSMPTIPCYPGSPCTLALSLDRPAGVAPREEPDARCGPPPQCTLCESKGGAGRTLRVGLGSEANGPCTPTPQNGRKPLRRTGGVGGHLTGDSIPVAVCMRWSAVQCIDKLSLSLVSWPLSCCEKPCQVDQILIPSTHAMSSGSRVEQQRARSRK